MMEILNGLFVKGPSRLILLTTIRFVIVTDISGDWIDDIDFPPQILRITHSRSGSATERAIINSQQN